jgi:predicted transcriptional regulator
MRAPAGTGLARDSGMTNSAERRLPIHLREVVGRNGLRSFEEAVSCPRRSTSMLVDECVDCAHCRHVTFIGAGTGSNLVCVVPVDLPAPVDSSLSDEAHVASVMTRVVHCVRPDTRVETAAALFVERGLRAAPVVDERARVLGVVSRADLVGVGGTVGLVMTSNAFVLPERATVSRAAELLMLDGIHCIPVVAPDRVILGIVTPRDITRWVARHRPCKASEHA